MSDTHKNFSRTLVDTAPTPATSGTTLIVTDATVFPAIPFNATVWPINVQATNSNAEIVRVTNISSNTLTITRGQEQNSGQSNRAIIAGDQIAETITAKTFTDIEAGGISIASQAANDLIYASSATQLARIAAAASSILITSASNVPSLSQTIPSAVQANITALGTIATGLWNGTIITSAYGGTSNGFTKFSGPASTEKTFTLPNASSLVSTSAVVALTDGATPALDASLGFMFTLAAAGNRTIAVPTNATNGQKIVIRHLASGAARTLALNSGAGGFRFGTDITALSQTASGKTDYIGCIYSSIDSFWDVVGYVKGF